MRVRRGNVAVNVALFSVLLLSMGAFGVDLPYARVVRMELEQATEAAAHAGAAQLDGTVEGVAAAGATARSLALVHSAGGSVVQPDAVETGVWDDDTFTPSTDATRANAVRVTASRPELALFFSPAAFSRRTVAVGGRAIAVKDFGGASELDCFLPLAVPQCLIEEWGMDSLQDRTIQLNPPGVDNVGWMRPDAAPNAAWTREQFVDCEASGELGVGDDIGLQNGQVTSALDALVNAVRSSSTTWDTSVFGGLPSRMPGSSIPASDYGHTLEGAIPVFDGGSEYCEGSGGSFNGMEVVTGFVWVVIYDVRNNGGAAQRSMRLRIDGTREHEVGTQGGGEDWGVTANSPPRFVVPG